MSDVRRLLSAKHAVFDKKRQISVALLVTEAYYAKKSLSIMR